jgi:release factor glutamine methyltransferase
VLSLLQWTTAHFEKQGIDTARLDAECLLAHALGVERLRLYVDFDKPVQAGERAAFRELVQRRASERIPVSQLLGSKEFWSLEFQVTRDVLTPRPDTETLVQAALDRFPEKETPIRVLDLGTGSGAIALAIAVERPQSVICATDKSQEALKLAQENAERLGNADRIRFVEGDWLVPVRGEHFDLVVSNPPYVAESERAGLPPELAHEPDMALFSGADGLDALRILVREIPGVLAPGGAFALEMAPDQASKVAEGCRKTGFQDVSTHRDLAGRPRVVSGLSSDQGE